MADAPNAEIPAPDIVPASAPGKRGPGRPPLSPEEKEARAAARARLAEQNAQLLKDAQRANPLPPPPKAVEIVPAKVPPDKDQVRRCASAISRTWGALEALIIGIAAKDNPKGKPLVPDERRARDLGDAWGDILAELLPDADMTIRVTVAGITTAACAGGLALAIRANNREAAATASEKDIVLKVVK